MIGGVHGCRSELESLLDELGYTLVRDSLGRAIDARHAEGRKAVFVGDLVVRGPDIPGVLRLVMGMVHGSHARAVPGNHGDKQVRALKGRKVRGRPSARVRSFALNGDTPGETDHMARRAATRGYRLQGGCHGPLRVGIGYRGAATVHYGTRQRWSPNG